jgi:hypothetical protein
MLMSEDTYIDNFYNWALPGSTPLTDEKPYWRDQLRAGHARGPGSILLAAIEMGKTLLLLLSHSTINRSFVRERYRFTAGTTAN